MPRSIPKVFARVFILRAADRVIKNNKFNKVVSS